MLTVIIALFCVTSCDENGENGTNGGNNGGIQNGTVEDKIDKEYTDINEYFNVCHVTNSGNNVIIKYDLDENAEINFGAVVLDNSKTYIFEFGNQSKFVKITGDNAKTFNNVRFSVLSRDSAFNLALENVTFAGTDAVIKSNAPVLNLGLYGANCTVRCDKASNGYVGEEFGALQIGNGGNGGNGANGATPIVCDGILNVICGAKSSITGGNGGDGGRGGNSQSSGSHGGNGGNGGNGAVAISATEINVSFVNEMTEKDLLIYGGAGGLGGEKGWGMNIFWIGKANPGNDGAKGISASASNVDINYK